MSGVLGIGSQPGEKAVSLRDFRTNSRMLVLVGLAIPVGIVSALVAKALLWLIAEITNLVFFQRFGAILPPLENHHLGAWIIAAPVVGALIIGLMARYGSEKIRGHGIPEALEAILLGRSLMEPKVALLKPISSAISIGTGGPFGAEGPIIMTGGAFGSIIAQFFHLTAAERKTLLVAGAAGGMAAVFATPIAATLARGGVAAFRMAAAQFHSRSRWPRSWRRCCACRCSAQVRSFPSLLMRHSGRSAILWASRDRHPRRVSARVC